MSYLAALAGWVERGADVVAIADTDLLAGRGGLRRRLMAHKLLCRGKCLFVCLFVRVCV